MCMRDKKIQTSHRLDFLTKIIVIIFVLCLFVPSVTFARNFLRTLKVGDYGEDVYFIQKVLNFNPATQVAQNGPGSPGHESLYFGTGTKTALIKFQNLYASDVLKPAGLSWGTGFAGWYTLKKINAVSDNYQKNLQTSASVASSTATSTSHVASHGVSSYPVIDSVSPTSFGNGDTVQIKGHNFTQDNTVLVSTEDDSRFTHIASYDMTSMSFSMNVSLSTIMEKQWSGLSAQTRANAIAFLISKNEFVTGPVAGAAYVKATLSVKNQNGESNYLPVLIRVINK